MSREEGLRQQVEVLQQKMKEMKEMMRQTEEREQKREEEEETESRRVTWKEEEDEMMRRSSTGGPVHMHVDRQSPIVAVEIDFFSATRRAWGPPQPQQQQLQIGFDRKEREEVARRVATKGTSVSAMDSMGPHGKSTGADLEQNSPYASRGIVPRHPAKCSPSDYIIWEQRFGGFLAAQGLRHTISPDAPEIAVISCPDNAYLFGQFGEDLVTDHRLAWWYISEATADTAFADCLYTCHSISDALRIMRGWSLPLYPVERPLLMAELERVQFMMDEDSEIVQFILRQFLKRPSMPWQRQQQRSRGGGTHQQQPLEEWRRSENMEMSMFTLSEEPPQTEPTAVVFAPTAPAAEALTGTSVFPAVSSKDMAEAPTPSAGTALVAVLSATPATSDTVFPPASVGGASRAPTSSAGVASTAVPSAAPATGSTAFPTALVGGASRATVSSTVGPASVESAAGPAISGTVPSTAPVRGAVEGRESSAGAVSSDATAEASLSTGGIAALVEVAAWPDRKLASAAGSAGDRRVTNIFGEKGEPTHPFDPGTVFPLEVRYSIESNSNSTSNQDPWGDTTSVVELLRPFDPGKGCQRDVRRGRAVLGVNLPFDRGKAWRRTQHGG